LITDLTTKTLAQLQELTKAQLIAAILEGQTDTELEDSEDGPHGQVRRVYLTTDRLTGKVLRRTRTDWSYHPNGDVDEITTVERDQDEKEIGRNRVKHHQDGREPELLEE